MWPSGRLCGWYYKIENISRPHGPIYNRLVLVSRLCRGGRDRKDGLQISLRLPSYISGLWVIGNTVVKL